MSYEVGMILATVVTLLLVGALFFRTRESRELTWTGAAVLGFWTLIIAIFS